MTRLNANYLLGVLSPGRHVRTRLYFTSGILLPLYVRMTLFILLTSCWPWWLSFTTFTSIGPSWPRWPFLTRMIFLTLMTHIDPNNPILMIFDLFMTRLTFWSLFHPDDSYDPIDLLWLNFLYNDEMDDDMAFFGPYSHFLTLVDLYLTKMTLKWPFWPIFDPDHLLWPFYDSNDSLWPRLQFFTHYALADPEDSFLTPFSPWWSLSTLTLLTLFDSFWPLTLFDS